MNRAHGVTMDELTPEQRFAAEDGEELVSRALAEGRAPEDIVAELVRMDWLPSTAEAFVAQTAAELRRCHESPQGREDLLRVARAQFFGGLMIIGVAVALTFILLVKTTGAIPPIVATSALFMAGFVLSTRGWARWRLYRNPALPPILPPPSATSESHDV